MDTPRVTSVVGGPETSLKALSVEVKSFESGLVVHLADPAM